MITTNEMKINTKILIKVVNDKGEIVLDKDLGPNIITSVGKAAVAGLVGNTGALTAFTYLAVGTSATAPAITDTALGSDISTNGLARASATVTRTTTTTTNDTLNLTNTWTVTGGTATIQEVGIFNAASAGVILGHKLTGAITTAANFLITITYQVIFS